ncbi:membrane protein, putative [Babesia bigemina]|uniref:Membrane protein, putative n=1 Tax=Babesia bigemina TaxID=5866 RepID=A0A061D6X9_BABBI|nr:membrane protein, putative [Babesia bigemina]CDR95752.1 membrane protein, putative [Babesia bigemina]|eukprot:XP_012767938.1 membrane protein, putative [Babesia bigemina]
MALSTVSAVHVSPKTVCKAITSPGVTNNCKFMEAANALNNNLGRKLSVSKSFRLGDLDVTCSLRSPDVDPHSRCGTQLVPINVQRHEPLARIEDAKLDQLVDEFKLEGTLVLDGANTLMGSVCVDMPKVCQYAVTARGKTVSQGVLDFADTLRRLDFAYQHADLVLHAAHNNRSHETSVELLKRMEDMYILQGKYVHITPKVELVFHPGLSPKSNFGLGIQRGKDSITPIFYPMEKKVEVLVEKTITDGLKAGLFWSKDNRLYINLSLSMPWGKNGWQNIAFRFVFPEVAKSHVHMLNEVKF